MSCASKRLLDSVQTEKSYCRFSKTLMKSTYGTSGPEEQGGGGTGARAPLIFGAASSCAPPIFSGNFATDLMDASPIFDTFLRPCKDTVGIWGKESREKNWEKIKKFGKTENLKSSKFRAFATRAKKLYSLNK